MASSSPYDKFMTMMSNWHDDNPWAFATNQREIANNCTYGTLQAFYLARQKLPRQTILSSWKAAVTPPARLVLSNARIVYADNSRQLTFASWAPSSPEDCLSDIVKILCKHPIEGEPDEGIMNPSKLATPGVFTSWSMKHQQHKCSSDANQWVCINKNTTECYIPNSLRKTCAIREVSTKYSSTFKTCGCGNDETMEPCTESEVRMLSYDWENDFKERFEGKSGAIMMRNMRVMEDSGSTFTDFGIVNDSACAQKSEYKGIFCRVDAAPTYADQTELRRNCDEAVSVDKINVTDYQCAYACYEAQNKCESSEPSNVSACFSLAKDDDPVLRQCSIPFELTDQIEKDSNMITGVVTLTTQWKSVTFSSSVSPHPVIFTSTLCISPEAQRFMEPGSLTLPKLALTVASLQMIAALPVFSAGLLRPLNTFGQVQVTGVSETGFMIRLALDYCRLGYATASAEVSWIAISEDSFTIPNASSALRVATTVVKVGQEVDLLPGVQLHSSDVGKSSWACPPYQGEWEKSPQLLQ
ncbi:hypothetical protein ENH_00074690 [Eimeria necatrix]|uniref:Uncharacterized protein n=1 Tax=Eimeria necatrix TaxID=51315 RepID=U6MK60_9EIME|nr:hypothetical protein ENH_00074690 [Eimeria necatrix]CDJ64607.1 hypothetical protein ENH_00074690 [Eimeria necatrix]